MYRVIETHPSTTTALVEHDDDASRWLLVPTDTWNNIPASLWARALAAGAEGIACVASDGSAEAVTADTFADLRTETASGTYSVAPEALTRHPHGLPTIGEAERAKPEISNSAHAQRSNFVHLHTHAEYSALDGLSTLGEAVHQVAADRQTALGLTDHGTCAGHPELQRACDAAGLHPVFGIEANLVDDRLARPAPGDAEAQKHIRNNYWHLCLYAENNTGLSNLWAASTESYRDGHYGRPRMDWSTLQRHADGVIASTGCLRGPIAVALADGDTETARQRLAHLMAIFPGRLYVEIQTNTLPKQQALNNQLIDLAREHGLPLLATVDSHFPTCADADAHSTWIAVQTNKDIQDETDLFSEDLDLYLQTEAEVRAALAYLAPDVVDEAVTNTAVLAARCTARIEGTTTTPVFTRDGTHDDDARRLRETCEANWQRRIPATADQQTYRSRFEREMDLLVERGFCGYYLMVADYCSWAKDNGILVGPGRGSGGGSLVAYLTRITSLDPIRHSLLFERFLTRGRSGLPDFDVDFPASRKADILAYLRSRYGQDHVVSIGTELRLKNKAVINDLGRVFASRLPDGAHVDLRKVCALIDEAEAGTAGLGMSWDELWTQHGDQLAPYAQRYPDLFAMAERLVGRLKSYGRHAAGVVISTDRPLTGWLPLRSVDGEEQMVTQWSMADVENLGLVKFDVLTLRTLDTVQVCLDAIREQRGIILDLDAWEEQFEDPMVWEEIADAHVLGVFQIETHSGTRLCEQMRPRSLPELADMITLVRPGPMNSGLTDAYLRRRAGKQQTSYPDERLREVLEPTHGCMIYQEQVMAVTRLLAGYSEEEADGVRSILGKKKIEKIAAAGKDFLARADMPREAAEHLWHQMAEFSKYSFNKSHAYAYGILAFWTAFLKVHYPIEFLQAAMSTVDKDRVPEFVRESRRLGVAVLPPDVNVSGRGFSIDPSAYAVRYGLDSIKGVGESAVADLVAHQPYSSWSDFETRRGRGANAGVVALLARVGAFDSLVPNRRGLEALLLARKTGADTRCSLKDETVTGPNGLPCRFDWDNEPAPVNPRTGKKLPRKKPPKRCTKACRQYTPRPALQLHDVQPYTAEDIREIERDMLGCYVSSTPFDRIDPVERAICTQTASQLSNAPNGRYIVAALISSIRKHPAKAMGWLELETEERDVTAVVFPDAWATELHRFKLGQLCFAEVRKNDRGFTLTDYQPL